MDLGDGAFELDWPSAEELRELYALTPLHRSDPKALFTYRPGLAAQPRAPSFHTNALTLVAGSDGKGPRDKPRVVLVGDEYVFGPHARGEACGALVEQQLAVDCMDATTSGYGPHAYLGAVESLARAKPQAIVVQWSPNDLFEAFEFERNLGVLRGERTLAKGGALPRIDVSERPSASSIVQRWTQNPGGASSALEAALRAVLELRRRCDTAGIPLLVVVLPAPTDPRSGASRATDGEQEFDLLASATGSFARTLNFWGVDVVEFADVAVLSPEHFEADGSLAPTGRAELARVVATRLAHALDPFSAWR